MTYPNAINNATLLLKHPTVAYLRQVSKHLLYVSSIHILPVGAVPSASHTLRHVQSKLASNCLNLHNSTASST